MKTSYFLFAAFFAALLALEASAARPTPRPAMAARLPYSSM
jgi:hypothetical protein